VRDEQDNQPEPEPEPYSPPPERPDGTSWEEKGRPPEPGRPSERPLTERDRRPL